MNTKTKIFLIPAAVALLQFGAVAQDKADDFMKAGQNELKAQKFDAAREAFNKVLSAADANTAKKVEAYIGIANSFLQVKPPQIPAAIAEYQKALALPDLAAKDKLRLLSMAAGAHERLAPPKLDEAAALYEQILAEASADNNAKISALQKLSNIKLGKKDSKAALDCLNKAVALPELKVPEKLNALNNLANFLSNQGEMKAAREVYQKMIEADSSDANKTKVSKLIADSWSAEGNFDKAAELVKQGGNPLDLADLLRRKGDIKGAKAELVKLLSDPQENKLKGEAFNRLITLCSESSDFAEAKRAIEAFLPKLMEADPNRPASLMPMLKSAMEKGNYEFGATVSEIIMKAPKLSDKDYIFVRLYKMNSLGGLKKTDDAAKFAESVASDEKVNAQTKLRFKLASAALGSSGKPGEAKAAFEKILAAVKPDAMKPKEKADAMLLAAKTALMSGKDTAARELSDMHEALFKGEPRPSYNCEFVDKAPGDVSAWLNSTIVKDPKKQAQLNRKYGNNLAFLLETDASTTGRGVSAPGAADNADISTELYMTCDSEGIHFFMMASDSKVAEVKSGLLGGGAYEGYLAPGKGQAYFCFLIDLPSGTLTDSFQTMYPNHYFRQALKKDDTLRSVTLPTEKGFGTYLFYSWELFYDKLPKNGDKWQFENIRWTRSDGYSWGGSESVHNRSSWGDLVFSGMTEKNLRDIKRKLIYKALAKYKLEKNAKAKGAIDHWQDEELGDPEFYKNSLAPLVTKLDELAKKVTKDMSDADVDMLFGQAVPDWMSFKFKTAELRTDYLGDKFFTEGPAKAAKP